MNKYHPVYEEQFFKNLRRYAALRQRIKKRVERILSDPYTATELLGDAAGKLNLRGCRSTRVDRNFRILFVVCEECRRVPECEYCFCEKDGQEFPGKTVIFLTVGPHSRAYSMK
jgi:mRNA-degrading endonuclease RelE of RelBE toxin-antitoxin system